MKKLQVLYKISWLYSIMYLFKIYKPELRSIHNVNSDFISDRKFVDSTFAKMQIWLHDLNILKEFYVIECETI